MTRNALGQLGSLALISALVSASTTARAQDALPTAVGGASVTANNSDPQALPPAVAPPPSVFVRGLGWATTQIDSFDGGRDGLYPSVGDLIPGSGLIRLGAGYRHHAFGDQAIAFASATMSVQRDMALQTGINWPNLWSERLSLGTVVKYQDFTRVNYFGIGSNSQQDAQTDYRIRTVDVVGSAAFHAGDRLTIGGQAGFLHGPSIDAGRSPLYPSIGERFAESSAPGLTSPIRYAHADVFIEHDSRNVPGYPTSGGVYRVDLADFHDLDGHGGSFRRMDVDGGHYIPLFHHNWIIALRGRVTLSQTGDGNEVPFYLLPTLGGGNTLRGYADYRFHDRDVALVSAEYRWPLFRMMDAAMFMDAGTVAPTPRELGRGPIDRDYGFGLRLHSTTRSIAHVDIARGPEGVRIIASFSAPLSASHRTVAPQVP